MESSKLKNLISELAAPIQQDPTGILEKVVPSHYLNLFRGIQGLANAPLISGLLPKGFAEIAKFDPGVLITSLFDKLNSLPNELWVEIESTVQGVIAGDPDATEKAKSLLGVVTDENQNQTI